MLLSSTFAFSQLKGSNEIYAMASLQVNPKRLLWPVIFIGIAGFMVCLMLNGFIVPSSNRKIKNFIFELAKNRIAIGIKEGVFSKIFPDFTIYVSNINSSRDRFEKIYINTTQHDEPIYIFAKKGIVLENLEEKAVTLRLLDGNIQYSALNKSKQKGSTFSAQDIDLKALIDIRPSTISSIKGKEDASLPEVIKNSKTAKGKSGNSWTLELHKRISLSLSAFLMIIVGSYLGLMQPSRPRWISLIIASFVVLFNYIALMIAELIATRQLLPPSLSMEMGNLLLLMITIFGFSGGNTRFLTKEMLFRFPATFKNLKP